MIEFENTLKERLKQGIWQRKDNSHEKPLRAELFSAVQMERHGKHLAELHKLGSKTGGDELLARLTSNEAVLIRVYNLLTETIQDNRTIVPAGEWFLDNFYLIEEQIRTARRHFPKGYSETLPRLANGPSAGLPRVYDIALEIISHGDGRVELESLSRFIAAYQKVTPLNLGELWAIPIMIRLACIENLRRIIADLAGQRTYRDMANSWADELIAKAEKDPNNLILVIANMAKSNPPMASPFVAELMRRLQGHGSALALPLTWIEQQLSSSGLTTEQLVHDETKLQAADQASISNSIGTLRFISSTEWRTFVETNSIVDSVLNDDPSGFYNKMDFLTRDQYRHVIEQIAINSPLSEVDVAVEAIKLARQAQPRPDQTAVSHVGYYLISKGLPELENAVKIRLRLLRQLRRLLSRLALLFYLGAIAVITSALTVTFYSKLGVTKFSLGWQCIIAFVLVLCTGHLAVSLINWLFMSLSKPLALPRLDFSKAIPPEYQTLVAVPAMLLTTKNIEDLIEGLEVRFLANRRDNLQFALLTDLKDAHSETLPEDEPLLQLARERIEQLNRKYKSAKGGSFFLFHRPRRWNAQENVYMGYERKRGKLEALNSFLRGAGESSFSCIVGDTTILSGVKYVITLDSDTELPRDAAGHLVGAMAHPLNRPIWDEQKQLVSDGYGILQPRVSASLPSTNKSRYAHLYGGESGIDPYTRAVSDIYQDLFGQGSFVGKGIYDIDYFARSVQERFPDNVILSHDLLEGCYARSGLITDVQLYEDYPSIYSTDVNRRIRWIRGDWQIFGWLLPIVEAPGRKHTLNKLSLLSRWKIFDNLRRSLTSAAFTLAFLLSWTVFPEPLFYTSFVALILSPFLLAPGEQIFRKQDGVLWHDHLSCVIASLGRHLEQFLFTLTCLPFEALFSLEAIIVTAYRMMVTHKHLLEWQTSSALVLDNSLLNSCKKMCGSSLLAGITAIYLLVFRPAALPIALPVLILWFIAPAIAWWLSQTLSSVEIKPKRSEEMFIRKMARRTWAFFQTFCGPDDNWLVADNFQEQPVESIARRTSPTNIGLSLLANLTAYDFGYITSSQLIERTTNTFNTMDLLERHRGHFCNWYQTQSLKPLTPIYISTVDSGNLAGHLLTLRPGLLAMPDKKIVDRKVFDGLHDTALVLSESLAEQPFSTEQNKTISLLSQFQNTLAPLIASLPRMLEVRASLEHLSTLSSEIFQSINANSIPQASFWAQCLAEQCSNTLNELDFLFPWLSLTRLKTEPDILNTLEQVSTLRQLAGIENTIKARLNSAAQNQQDNQWLSKLQALLSRSSDRAVARIASVNALALRAHEFAQMDYDFLFNQSCNLLAIGYNISESRIDTSYYDLLASEARLTNFVAIAQGQLPQESWFALGRLLTANAGSSVLFSWSGSMFEYLMPLLVMPTYEHSLLDQTYHAAVQRQIEYGKERGVPWGISESGYSLMDAHLTYQYRAFGVPGLGLQRGLVDDLVIAPYASALALMVSPEAALQNLQGLASEGFVGKFGFYEAIDYTPARLPRGQSHVVVKSYMAHHQAMTMLSFAYLLFDRPMQKLFESDPAFQSTMLLLQERVPALTAFHWQNSDVSARRNFPVGKEAPVRIFNDPDTPSPEVHLLSNGRYHVMCTNAGGGYSRWHDLCLTRWREDSTLDNWGTFCYIRDTISGQFWSTSHQPTLKPAETYTVIFTEAKAEFRRRDSEIDTYTELTVSSEDDIELRKLQVTNRSGRQRTLEITSYAEVVLASSLADAQQPAFSNLFVQTEIIDSSNAIVATRRPRSPDEKPPWLFHLMAEHQKKVIQVSYETDRAQFIGRGRTAVNPLALEQQAPLSGSQGSVLDPIVAIRYRLTLAPDESATINIVTGVAETRDRVLQLIEKYRDRGMAERVFELAWTHAQVVLRQLNATEADAQLYAHLANSIIYSNSFMRADASVLIKNRRGQSGLWGYAISGDLPIVLLHIKYPENIELARQLIQAHAYWRLKGLAVDLMIINEDTAGYRQILYDQITGLIAGGTDSYLLDKPGGIFIRPADQVSIEDRILFQSVARCVVSDSRGSLEQQLSRRTIPPLRAARLKLARSYRSEPISQLPPRDLILFNGSGGFTRDGREYVISTSFNKPTPAPWVNVLANPYFGSVISENGASYSWAENSHEFRLTPWHNDPITDTSGEAIYICDQESGHFWSPSPLPSRGINPYVSRHGFGYSVFEHTEDGIVSELTVHVALDAPIKFSSLKIRNISGRPRKISVTGYVEWVLGDIKQKSAMQIVTQIDSKTGAIFAQNSYNTEFQNRVNFFDVDDSMRTFTCDRTEFLGRNGSLANPLAMSMSRLLNKTGSGLDPCAAIQIQFDLANGQEREIIFRLGSGHDANDASNLVNRFRGAQARYDSYEKVCEYWKHTLGTVNVQTPDDSINMLTNGWLLYQTIACRIWGRTGFYQSGGAFGFRDQIQDTMALIYAEPRILREQLILSASRQFLEGDAQHWWHPPSGRGIRSHCSDDFLWLPMATRRYVVATGDTGVLDEQIHFLEGPEVKPEEESYYALPAISQQSDTLYEHCKRAIKHGLRFGQHGLPLMGSGDWNDGMNLVGIKGQGESIWLGFFLYDILKQFQAVARLRNDLEFISVLEQNAEELRRNLDKNAWDGEWYRRAYFDDGTPLGSNSDPECKIDSIAQSWSILSGAGEPGRAVQAMNSLDANLVHRDTAIIQLLAPPFDKSDLSPGYIKGYVPGVRENGGQYTHAAIWAAMAYAAIGDNRRFWELLQIINPVNHGKTPAGIAVYKVEPYVVAGDVYACPPHTGRGGWTWYTGSAGWLYRLIVESLLGLRLERNELRFQPCLPEDWKEYKIHYRYYETVYHITVSQISNTDSGEIPGIIVDGACMLDAAIFMNDDRREHFVEVKVLPSSLPSKQ